MNAGVRPAHSANDSPNFSSRNASSARMMRFVVEGEGQYGDEHRPPAFDEEEYPKVDDEVAELEWVADC